MISINPLGRRSRARLPLLLGGILLVVALGSVALLRDQAGALLWRVLSPVVSLRNALGASEARALRAELAAADALVADRNALYRENLDLKSRLGRQVEVARVLGVILSRPPATPYDTLMLDIGSMSGVGEGVLVSAGGTTIVGRVSEVMARNARVVLTSAPGEEHQAQLLLADGALPIVLVGQGGGSLRAQVPAGTSVARGDSIVLPNIAGGYMGRVTHVEQGSESFINVYAQLPANIFALERVEVWLSRP